MKKLAYKKYIFFKMDAKFFSSIKKYKKSNAIGFESVPLNIKIGVFVFKKRAFFFLISSYIIKNVNVKEFDRNFLQPCVI